MFVEQSNRQLILKVVILLSIYALMLANVAGWYFLDIRFLVSPNREMFDVGAIQFSFGLSEGYYGPSIEAFRSSFLKWTPLYLVICVSLPFLDPVRSSVVISIAALVILVLSLYGYADSEGLFLRFGLLALVVIFSIHVLISFFTEYRERRQISTIFSRYIPAQLARRYFTKTDVDQLKGATRDISVLFCDIQGFTSISEQMPAQELAEMLHRFFTGITKVIHRNAGVIDKYMGDCVMAMWGAPIDDPLHAQHALLCADEIHGQLELLEPEFKAKNWPKIRVGVGLAAGECVVGNMGSDFRIAYTAVGNIVNLAARLEKLTRSYGVHTVVSESVKDNVSQQMFRELDIVKLKGRSRYMKIFEPLDTTKTSNPVLMERLEKYELALSCYRKKEWDIAEASFRELVREDNADPLYAWYLDSIHRLRRTPPEEGWVGQLIYRNTGYE